MTDDVGGWYPDPEGVPGRERWWDGARWTDRTRDPSDELVGWADGPVRAARRRTLLVAAGVGVAVLAVAAAVVVNRGGPSGRPAANPLPTTADPTGQPPDGGQSPAGPSSPALSCPPAPPASPPPSAPASIPPARGARVTDPQAGISYAGQGEPWRPWRDVWVTPGLQARFGHGYYLVTQHDTPLGDYYATVLSGTVSAQVGDAPHEETRCVAEQVAEDVRTAYYPEPNVRRNLDRRAVSLDGRAGYLVRYHLAFDVHGYVAKGEQVGILVLDVGRPDLAVVYVSIPDSVRGFDYVLDQVVGSVRSP